MSEKHIERDGVPLVLHFNLNGVLCISAMINGNRLKYLYSSYDSVDECIDDFMDFYYFKVKQIENIIDDE